jgi:hypothetical protein
MDYGPSLPVRLAVTAHNAEVLLAHSYDITCRSPLSTLGIVSEALCGGIIQWIRDGIKKPTMPRFEDLTLIPHVRARFTI